MRKTKKPVTAEATVTNPVTADATVTNPVTADATVTNPVTADATAEALQQLETKKFEDWKEALKYIENTRFLDMCSQTLGWKAIYSCYGKRDFSSCLERVNAVSDTAKRAIMKVIRRYDYRKCFSFNEGKITVTMPDVPVLMPDDLKAIKNAVNAEKAKAWYAVVSNDKKAVNKEKAQAKKAEMIASIKEHDLQQPSGLKESFYQAFIKLFDKSTGAEKAFMANCLHEYFMPASQYVFDNTYNAEIQDSIN